MINLRPGQDEVARYRNGYMAVPAIPGAGKTTVLAHLAASLIEEKRHLPGKILIVTVMNSAVSNFKARINNFLANKNLPKNKGFEVKTLHSLAYTILKERPDRLLIDENFNMIDEFYQNEIIERITMAWIHKNLEIWESVLDSQKLSNRQNAGKIKEQWTRQTIEIAKQLIAYFKGHDLSVETLKEKTKETEQQSFVAWFTEIYAEYQRELARLGLMDFHDLIGKAKKLLVEDQDVLSRLRNKWPYIFEDEAQDSTPLQEEIMYLLAGEKGNLVRVGDSNQAIMGTFTTSEPELFRGFSKRSDVVCQPLNYASRSSKDIIELANRLVTWVRKEYPEKVCRDSLEEQFIMPVPPEDDFPNPTTRGYTITTKSFKTNEEELAGRIENGVLTLKGIARLVVDYVNNPQRGTFKTVAVLAPTNNQVSEIKKEIMKLGMEPKELSNFSSQKRATVDLFSALLDFLAHPYDNVKMVDALKLLEDFKDLGEDENLILKKYLLSCQIENLLYPLEAHGHVLNINQGISNCPLWDTLIEYISRIKNWLEATRIPPESLILYLAHDLELMDSELAMAHKIAAEVKSLLQLNPSWRLDNIVAELKHIYNSLNHFASIVYERGGYEPLKGEITIANCHKAKGLEWDTVFVVGLTPNFWPGRINDYFRSDLWYLKQGLVNPVAIVKAQLQGHRNIDDAIREAKYKEISEKIRLLYVAITRARENLVLSYHEKRIINKWQKPAGASLPVKMFEDWIEERKRVENRPK